MDPHGLTPAVAHLRASHATRHSTRLKPAPRAAVLPRASATPCVMTARGGGAAIQRIARTISTRPGYTYVAIETLSLLSDRLGSMDAYRPIDVLSDSTGETAERVVRAALLQFPARKTR